MINSKTSAIVFLFIVWIALYYVFYIMKINFYYEISSLLTLPYPTLHQFGFGALL